MISAYFKHALPFLCDAFNIFCQIFLMCLKDIISVFWRLCVITQNVETKQKLQWKSADNWMARCTSCSSEEGSLANMAVNCQLNIPVQLIFTSHVPIVYYRDLLKVTFGAGVRSDTQRVSRKSHYMLYFKGPHFIYFVWACLVIICPHT